MAIDLSDFTRDQVEQYNDMLNECYPPCEIGSMEFDPSDVLLECDPVAYRCGLIDYIDSIEQEEEE